MVIGQFLPGSGVTVLQTRVRQFVAYFAALRSRI